MFIGCIFCALRGSRLTDPMQFRRTKGAHVPRILRVAEG